MYGMGLEMLLNRVLATRVGRLVVSALTAAGITMLAAIVVPLKWHDVVLSRQHVRTTAEVTQTHQFVHSDLLSSDTYAVQYAFDVDGRSYFHRAPYGNGWSDLPKEEWESASRRGTVDVIYAPQDPWLDALARDEGGLFRWAAAWIVGLVVVAAGAWYWLARVLADEVRRIVDPTYRPVLKAPVAGWRRRERPGG